MDKMFYNRVVSEGNKNLKGKKIKWELDHNRTKTGGRWDLSLRWIVIGKNLSTNSFRAERVEFVKYGWKCEKMKGFRSPDCLELWAHRCFGLMNLEHKEGLFIHGWRGGGLYFLIQNPKRECSLDILAFHLGAVTWATIGNQGSP